MSSMVVTIKYEQANEDDVEGVRDSNSTEQETEREVVTGTET